jgi:hypothetical protein
MSLPDLFMVFDVESVGLHGDAYAVGWSVIDRAGAEREAGGLWLPIHDVRGTEAGRRWAVQNASHGAPPGWGKSLSPSACPLAMRRTFWLTWLRWKAKGAALAADCCWPVEARFLAACVDDRPDEREWEGPYPLLDVACFRLAAGLDPLATAERLPSELPAHDPLADARQSARLLAEALALLGGKGRAAPAPEPRPGLSCWVCRKPIEGPVVYQGGSLAHPAHPGCLIVPCS